MGLSRYLRRKWWDQERARELESYLELEIADNLARGMTPEEARSQARRKLGNITSVRGEIYRMNSLGWVETLWRNLHFAWRSLRKQPGFSLAVVAVLALGIGANTAIFTIVNAVLLRPLPFEKSDRLVRLFHYPPQKTFPGVRLFSVSPANFLDWQSQNHVFDGMSIYKGGSRTLGGENPHTLRTASVSHEFFSVIRAQPRLGRTFLAEDDRPDHPKVAVISDGFWRSELGANPRVLGTNLLLDGQSYSIVGVMPASVEVSSWGATAAQVWMPLALDDAQRAVRANHDYSVVARLKEGVEVSKAAAEMDTISSQLAEQYPTENTGWGAVVIPLQELLVGNVRTSLLVLLGAVGLVLLIACANVANLAFARTLSRRKEIAIRTALGASRGQVLGQVLSETMLLALAGGTAGFYAAHLALRAFHAALSNWLPRGDEIAVDGSVLGFTLAVVVLTGIAAGAVPALRTGRVDLNETLKQGGRTDAAAPGGRTRSLLVVAEVALSLVLLIGAGLMIRTLGALRQVDLGIDPHNVLTLSVSIPLAQYSTPARESAFWDDALARVRALPGVESAGAINQLPASGGGAAQPIAVEGRASATLADQPVLAVRQSTPQYLRAMRIPLQRGRDFEENDVRAVLLSALAAKQLWPNEDPIGKRIRFPLTPSAPWEVVGIVGDAKQTGVSVEERLGTIYQWQHERPWSGLTLAIRTSADPHSLARAVTGAIHQVDSQVPVQDVLSMEERLADSLAPEWLSTWLLGGFAGMALLLAGVGIYSVLAYAVRRQTREIGIRMALGAGLGQVLRMVLLEGMKPALAGVLLGVAGAVSLARVLSTLVYGVSPWDPLTYAAVCVVLAAVAALACVGPAWRASRVDPVVTLREE